MLLNDTPHGVTPKNLKPPASGGAAGASKCQCPCCRAARERQSPTERLDSALADLGLLKSKPPVEWTRWWSALVSEAETRAKPLAAKRRLDMSCTDDTGRWRGGPEGFTTLRAPHDYIRRALKALHDGATVDGGRVLYDAAGQGRYRCERPVLLIQQVSDRAGKFPAQWSQFDPGKVGTRLETTARCRQCPNCLKAKAAFWKMRAIRECERASRTWFVTLTFSPDQRAKCEYAARLRLDRGGIANPTDAEWLRYLRSECGKEVTRWLKRVRKARSLPYVHRGERCPPWDTAAFRYLLVWERHKDGFPHAHLLIHEGSDVITRRRLEHTWTSGHVLAQLVGGAEINHPAQAAGYTCKYIAKSPDRVFASRNYGQKPT